MVDDVATDYRNHEHRSEIVTDIKRGQWVEGQSGNPSGRPKVPPRQALADEFTKRLVADFRRHGKEAIEAAREKNPVAYLKVIEGMVPKDVQHKVVGKVTYIMNIGEKPGPKEPKIIDVTPSEDSPDQPQLNGGSRSDA